VRLLRPLLLTSLALLAPTLGAVPPQAQEQPQYEVIDLGTLGGERSQANAINDRGEVVGWAETGEENEEREPARHAFLWNPELGLQDLGTLGGEDSEAHDINARSQVTGWADLYPAARWTVRRAFLWSAPTGMTKVRGFDDADGNFHYSEAHGINDAGLIVGVAVLGGGPQYKATLWHRGRVSILPHGEHGIAQSINERGQIAGTAMLSSSTTDRAHLWRPRRYTMRRSRTCYDYGDCYDTANDLNNRGAVAGSSERGPLLAQGKRITHLGLLAGHTHGEALALNERAQVVGSGWAWVYQNKRYGRTDERAFLWERGSLRDLTTLLGPDSGWVLEAATDINEHGQIVGYGLRNGVRRAFLLTRR